MTATLREVIEVLDTAYPPSLAESWDSVGLVTGDPGDPVRKVLLAVDATAAVVDQALEWGADLLLVHHHCCSAVSIPSARIPPRVLSSTG